MGQLKLHKAPYLDAELSFLEALAEDGFCFGDNPLSLAEIQAIGVDVIAYYQDRQNLSQPITLRNGEVVPRIAQTDFWLVENNDAFIGQITLRAPELPAHLLEMGGHIGYSIRPSMYGKGYGTKMLGLLLQQLDKKEYPKVLITCNEPNKASARVIEKNGGVLQDVIDTKYNPGIKMCRYHIEII
jgi:predicted acetyltransferase